ncbi:hypothetical protein ASD19_06265 [Microbacterium sp. Root53]|nr:hypothetical protein ASD19_06265 [Microbacterium sp. Root53]
MSGVGRLRFHCGGVGLELGEDRRDERRGRAPVAQRARVEPVEAEQPCGSARNSAPTARRSDTGRAPAAAAAAACARASRREIRELRLRSGCGTGRSAPRSGHVPTTTAVPRARRRRIASVRCATAT